RFDRLPAEFVPGIVFRSRNGLQPTTSPDGKMICQPSERVGLGGASRSKDYSFNAVVLRELQTGKILHTLTGHSADIVAMAFSPAARRLATASFDRTLKLGDTQTGRDLFTLRGHTGGLRSFAFSPDGNQIVSGGIDFTARVWNATPLPSKVIAEHDAR